MEEMQRRFGLWTGGRLTEGGLNYRRLPPRNLVTPVTRVERIPITELSYFSLFVRTVETAFPIDIPLFLFSSLFSQCFSSFSLQQDAFSLYICLNVKSFFDGSSRSKSLSNETNCGLMQEQRNVLTLYLLDLAGRAIEEHCRCLKILLLFFFLKP